MESKERKIKIDELKEGLKNIGDKIKDATDTVAISSMYAKDELDAKIEDAKSSLEATKENARLTSEKAKGKLASYLLKTQMEMKEPKKEKDKEKLQKYIDDRLDFAKDSLTLALMDAKEAKLAFLEALEAQAEYDELYGEE